MMSESQNGGRFWILRPLTQAGFAGFCALLLGMQIWLIKRDDQRFDQLLEMQRENHAVQREMNQTIERLSRAIESWPRSRSVAPDP